MKKLTEERIFLKQLRDQAEDLNRYVELRGQLDPFTPNDEFVPGDPSWAPTGYAGLAYAQKSILADSMRWLSPRYHDAFNDLKQSIDHMIFCGEELDQPSTPPDKRTSASMILEQWCREFYDTNRIYGKDAALNLPSPKNALSLRYNFIDAVRETAEVLSVVANLVEENIGIETHPSPPKSVKPLPVTPSQQVEAEILRVLAKDFGHLKAKPTAIDYYQEHIINNRSMVSLAESKGWKNRTMKLRKAKIEEHLSRVWGTPVDLDLFRIAKRKSARIVYSDPGIIERTHGNESEHEDD